MNKKRCGPPNGDRAVAGRDEGRRDARGVVPLKLMTGCPSMGSQFPLYLDWRPRSAVPKQGVGTHGSAQRAGVQYLFS